MTYKLWARKGAVVLIAIVLVAAVMTAVASLGEFRIRCEDISGKVLRLHVLANSDSEEDQALKLQVRDAVLEASADSFRTAQSKADAMEKVAAQKESLQAVAQKTVWENGYDYPVTVELTETYFNTRTYGEITMPAGYYDAFQVKIGAAEGKNWWCVLFPAICVPAAIGSQLDDVLSDEELEVVEGDGYEIRFKVVEWYEMMAGWFR